MKRGKDVLTRAEVQAQLRDIWLQLEPIPSGATELADNEVSEFPVAIVDHFEDGNAAIHYHEPGVVVLRPRVQYPVRSFVEALLVSEVIEGDKG
jgi:hypothetical protein